MSVLDGKPNRLLEMVLDAPSEPRFKPVDELLQSIAPVEQIPKIPPKFSFSRSLARSVGIIPALILRFIAWKVQKSTNIRDNRQWYYAPYRDVALKYPFLSEITVYRAIKLLESKKFLEVGNYNRRKADRTNWFTVTEVNRNLSDSDLIFFSPEVAQLLDIKAAVVYEHLKYTLEHKPGALRDSWLRVWPCDLAECQPLSQGEAKSALRELLDAGLLVKNSADSTGCYYRLGSESIISGVYDFEATPMENEAGTPSF